MPATVRIKDILEALEMQFDDAFSYPDLDTGEVENVSRDLLREAEESDDDEELDIPEWQEHEWEVAKRIISTDRFLKLPTMFDVHECAIMDDFSRSVESRAIRDDLLDAIHRSRAFRNFKFELRRHGIESDWFQFRTDALRQIAIDWCEEHHIVWE